MQTLDARPMPPEGALRRQGLAHVADRLDCGDWRVTYARP